MKIFLRVRKTVQVAAAVSLLLIMISSYGAILYQVYGRGGDHVAGLMEGKWNYWMYKAFAGTFGALREPAKLADGFKGTYWSITVFGLTITDPLAGLGYLAAAKSIYPPLILSMLIPLMLALSLGRVFCGWICPMNSLLEVTDGLRNRLGRGGLLPSEGLRLAPVNKYFLLGAIFIAAAVSGVSVFPYLMPQLHLGKEVFQAFYFRSLSWGVFFIGGIVIFEIFFSRRGWCRYLCPAGALLSLLAVPSHLRVRRVAPRCALGCHSCIDACPMGLEPNWGKSMMECTQCGLCLSRCESGLLGFQWRGNRRFLVSAGVVLGFLALASIASAHHLKGIPHYGYTENYPQNASQEQIVRHKNYSIYVSMYNSEGLHREKLGTPQDALFYIYIKNMENGKPYTGPIEVAIERKGEKAEYRRSGPDDGAIYRVRHSFQEHRGKCLLRIRFDGVEGQENAMIKMKLN